MKTLNGGEVYGVYDHHTAGLWCSCKVKSGRQEIKVSRKRLFVNCCILPRDTVRRDIGSLHEEKYERFTCDKDIMS